MRQSLTITERTGEDANGAATTRVSTHVGAFSELTLAERRNVDGSVSADTVFAAIRDLTGYGVTWSVKPGDTITCDGKVAKVSVTALIVNPRTGHASHLEVRGG